MLLTTKLKRSVILLASLLFAAILLGSLVSISTAMNLEPGNRNTDNGLKTTANEGLAVKSDAEIEANVNLAAMTIYTSGQNYLLNGDFSLLQYSGNYIKDGGFVSDNYINNGDFEELRPEHNLITNGDFSNGYASWTIVAGMTSGDTVGNPAPSAVFGVQGSSSDTNIIQQSFYAAEVGTMSISFDFYHNNPYTAHPQWRLYFEDKIIASGSAQNGTWGNYITYYTMEEPGTYTLEFRANKPQYVGSARVDNVVVQINGEFPAEWEIASGMALGKDLGNPSHAASFGHKGTFSTTNVISQSFFVNETGSLQLTYEYQDGFARRRPGWQLLLDGDVVDYRPQGDLIAGSSSQWIPVTYSVTLLETGNYTLLFHTQGPDSTYGPARIDNVVVKVNNTGPWTIVAGMSSGESDGNPPPGMVFGTTGSLSNTNVISQPFYVDKLGTLSIAYDHFSNEPFNINPRWRLHYEGQVVASGQGGGVGTEDWRRANYYYTLTQTGTYTLEFHAELPAANSPAMLDNVEVRINHDYPAIWEITAGMIPGTEEGNSQPDAMFGVSGSLSMTNVIEQDFYIERVGTLTLTYEYLDGFARRRPGWQLLLDGEVIDSQPEGDLIGGSSQWMPVTYNVAFHQTGNYTLLFHAEGPDSTYGPAQIDNAAVYVDGEIPILDFMVWNKETSCVGVENNLISTQGLLADPINPRDGNFLYLEKDLTIPVAGCSLGFERAYASAAIDYYTSNMGFGWTHNYDMRLHLTGTKIPGTVEAQTPGGSRLPFYDNGDGTYTPYAGVTAELAQIGSTYVITGFNQKVYTFDAQGLLQEQADPYGNVITFTYNISDQLIRAGQGDRYLTYGYDGSGRLTSVMDNLDREVTLEYDANGDLITATNALDLPTTYEYSGTTHLLTKVTDPSGTVVEETAYDNEGRAYKQWNGEDNLRVEIDYSLANTRVVTENGVVMTYTYDARNTLVGIEYACTDGTAGCQAGSSITYDGNFKQDDVVDLNSNPTTLDWNAGGSNLEYVKDALDNETFLAYDQYNNLTQTIDARDNTTRYFYDNPSFPTFLTRMTDALDKTTYFTPTTSADGVPGLLKQQEDPDGRITTYDYNAFGQITEMVVAAGTSNAITTTYDYDAVGRLTTTTQSSVGESHTSLNVYDDGDRLIATIGNWTGSNQANWATDCDISSGARDTNVCTLYDYDDAGRIISTTNTLGQTNLTFYDGAGRTFLSVTNWDGSSYNANNPLPDLCNFSSPDPEFNLCRQTEYDAFGRVYTTTNTLGYKNVTEYDSLGRVSRSITNWQDGIFDANDPDGDIETVYEYDANGNVLVVTDTVGRMTRTFYDALNRVEGSITNWDGSTVLDDCGSLPTMRDDNICTQYEYDEVGNTIIVTDTLGRMSRTFYDDLNRVEATVLNWQPSLTSPDNCVLSPTNNALENICTLYGYDDTGNQITTTNALNQTSLTVYDSANRPFLTVRNWDGAPISSENDCSFPPAVSDVNVCSVTYFDELGRRSGSKDALGNLTDYEYDGLGRLITTTRYLENGTVPVETTIEYDALGNRLTQTDAEGNDISFLFDELNRMETSTTEEGVTQTSYYNAAGWVTQTVDTLLHATTFGYDDLGRRLTVTDAESNVTTYEYDALGNQTAMIDAETIRTTYEYDDLNRLVQVIENDVPGSNPTHETDVVTEYSYDALGNRVHITNALGITNTHTTYDVLNRPWIVEDALGNQTVTLYNALGYRVVMTDGNEAITTYGYDGLNRLETVNYLADGIVVTYEYDALGNRKVMTDDLGTTSYDYDALYRLTEVIDPFNATVEYGYDKVGNRTSLTYPDSRMVTYTYDFDNRLETVLDWDTGTTTYEYDLAGRLITTTLPSGVVSVNSYDDANRLTNLSHTSSNDVLIANFAYELDKVGNRITATETIRQPGALAWVTAFLEENGQLVLEAESGTATAGTSHTWNSQTVQGDYAGTAYLRALPDIGQQYDATATADSPGLNFTVQIDNPGSYTVWARGMAPDAAGDSLHVGVNDGTPTTAANLTGFTPNEWSWSRLTMSNTNATVDLSSSGTYTLNVWMREDGLRLDKLMLVTDTATIPTGQGPLESGTTTALPPLGDQFITYEYDPLYRLTEAIYTGTFNGTYQYEYDAVGNRETYTTTIATTEVTSYQYDDANRLTQSTIQGGDTTTYEWDDASRLITTTVASTISRVYGYSQDGDMLSALVDGETTTFLYDGNGNRLQMTVGSEVTIYTLDYAKGFRTLMEQGGAFAETKHYLYGLACVGELVDADEPATKEWRYYQRDGNSLVRQTTNEEEAITLAWAFSPEGAVVLGEEGPVTNLDCGNNATYDWSTGLIFKNGRYFDPNTGIWLTLGGVFIWNASWRRRFSRYGKRRRKMLLFLLYVFAAFSLIGCGSNPTPTVTSTPCPTPFDTPIPGLPSSTPMSPISTIGSPSTLTPVPTSIQFPTNIPTSSPTPYPTLPINPTPSGAQLAEYTYNWLNDRNNAQVMNAWWFNDNVSPGLLDQKEVIALNMQYEGISALGQNIPGFLEAFARQYHGNCGGCSMDDPRFWNFIGHNESWNAASTNNQVLNDYLSTDLHSMPVYNLAEEVLNPSNSTWRRGKDDNRPWSWFNVLSNHPTWLIERMNNWPDINFWYRRPDKLFAVLTPNQQKALCGQDQNGHEVSCAALTSSSPEPSN